MVQVQPRETEGRQAVVSFQSFYVSDCFNDQARDHLTVKLLFLSCLGAREHVIKVKNCFHQSGAEKLPQLPPLFRGK